MCRVMTGILETAKGKVAKGSQDSWVGHLGHVGHLWLVGSYLCFATLVSI
jgi:hypothetical protein